jgi:thiol:disulfide interchange protein
MEKLTPSVLSMLALEFIKLLLRRFTKLGQGYDFPLWFYTISLPVLNMFSALVFAALGLAGYAYPTDWLSWVKEVIVVLLLSLASMGEYELTFARAKKYVRSLTF